MEAFQQYLLPVELNVKPSGVVVGVDVMMRSSM